MILKNINDKSRHILSYNKQTLREISFFVYLKYRMKSKEKREKIGEENTEKTKTFLDAMYPSRFFSACNKIMSTIQ